MTHKALTVFIVDDDKAVRDSLADLVDSVGHHYAVFANANDFLANYTTKHFGVLVLDIRMPDMSGLELQQELIRRDSKLPIIFITGHGDVPMAVQAIQNGAMDFIQKPFRDQDLLDSINHALNTCNQQQNIHQQTQSVKKHIHDLTPREHQVMEMIVEGKANKVIAIDLSLSQRTVEVHRKNVMHKLEAHSVAELVRIVTKAGII